MRDRAGALFAVAGLLPGMLGLSSRAAAVAVPDDSVHTFLTGTVALSPSDAWTVGWFGIGTSVANSEALHWNGTQWVSVKTAPEGLNANGLEGVSAVGPSDIWAVGDYETKSHGTYVEHETGGHTTLVEHYDGKQWTQVSTPNPSDGGYFSSVAASPASFAVAAGWHGPDPSERPLIEQGNGQTWHITRQ